VTLVGIGARWWYALERSSSSPGGGGYSPGGGGYCDSPRSRGSLGGG
jgi:hypothetical protein